MTRLLVSVRDEAEAIAALAGGAAVIDVKEPSRGSLGAAHPRVWHSVARAVRGRARLSIALGELLEESSAGPEPSWGEFPASLAFFKLGLAGCARRAEWEDVWRARVDRIRQVVPEAVSVAAAYADWELAGSPCPERVVEAAATIGCGGLLIDTFTKHPSRCLLSHVGLKTLAAWLDEVRRRGMFVALAGSLDFDSIPVVLELKPDYIAVRGAACPADRTGSIDRTLVARLVNLVQDGNGRNRR